MTMDRTLKTRGGLMGQRSVLSRAERIQRLIDEGKFDSEKDSPMGLPKTRVRHSRAGMKAKKAAETPAEGAAGEAGAEGATPAAAPAGEKGAKSAKSAKPGKGKGKGKGE